MTSRPAAQPAQLPSDFGPRMLVDCPACGAAAIVDDAPRDPAQPHAQPRQMHCTACPKRIAAAVSASPSLGLNLRLQVPTRHGVLVAWNEAHLDYLEHYIADGLRREHVSAGGVRNRSVISRLPAWVKSAKNREEILKGIASLRRRQGLPASTKGA